MKFKKILKKISVVLITLTINICLFGIFANNKVFANTKTFDDSGVSSWETVTDESSLVNGMQHDYIIGTSTTSGTSYYEQVNMFQMKTDGVNSKLVLWGQHTTRSALGRNTLARIAKDYEANHPGWIVVGGINADQYYQSYGSGLGTDGSYYYYQQPYYPAIMDGERRYPISPYNNTTSFVGFSNDGTNDTLIHASSLAGYSLTIIDEAGNKLNKFTVEKVNQTPTGNETAVWSSYISPVTSEGKAGNVVSQEVTSNNENIYFINLAELAYMNNSREYVASGVQGTDSFFGRGVITNITNNVSVGKNQFAIQTNNAELINALTVGSRIVVQYDYTDERLNNVEAGSGYHSVQRMNGVDNTSNAGYNTKQYNRSIFGKKADGTYVLITVDYKSTRVNGILYGGQNFTQTNAMLKAYDVVEAYQDDGGGSVTAIVRNKKGDFDVTNLTSDGAPRSILTGLFFVVRDPGFSVGVSTRNTVTLYQENDINYSTVSNAKVVINNTEFAFVDGKCVVTGLEEDTQYTFNITYDIADVNNPSKTSTFTHQLFSKTAPFLYPASGLKITNVADESFTVTKAPYLQAPNIRDVVVHVGDKTYQMGNSDTYVVTDLIKDTEYSVYFEYNVYDPETNKNYPKTDEAEVIKTLNFKPPYIESFTLYKESEGKYIFKYEYEDVDGVVSNAYLLVDNGTLEKIPVNKKSGNVTFEGVDLLSATYKMKFVIEYDNDVDLIIVESETLVYEKIEIPFKNPTIDKFEVARVDGNSYTFNCQYTDESNAITKIYLLVNGTKQDISLKEGLVTVNNIDLTQNDYSFNLVIEYLNPQDGNKTLTSSPINYQQIIILKDPLVNKFEVSNIDGNNYTFDYSFTDESGLVKKAYILVNDTKYEIDKSTGQITINDVDLTNSSYTFKLVLEYEKDNQTKTIASSTITYDEIAKKKGCKKKDISYIITLTIAISTMLIIIKKKK